MAASRDLKINEALIEKDYFVMYVLAELNRTIKGLLFKGGTCCSHAYKVIDRFSEDIDLSLDLEHFGRTHNISANKAVIDVCDRLGLKILNKNKVEKHTHGSFNRFYIEYPISFPSESVKPFIQVETTFYIKSYPDENRTINSILGEWLVSKGHNDIAEEYDVVSFDICVQKLERTFIDKVFAICDYYERKEVDRNSRHIYDLYKIFNAIDISDQSLADLVKEVKNDRKKNERCVSAQDGYDVNATLEKIIYSGFYKSDYKNITMLLLTKPVEYDTSITVLDKIIQSRLFD